MAIFTLTCATGAPGVTTTALGLTLAWPRDVVLVDADRCASQAVLAGYLNGVATGGRGLTSLAQSYRDGIDIGTDLPSHMVPLRHGPSDGSLSTTQRWFIPGFARPGSANLFEPVWPELMLALGDLDRQGIDVILDAGRWGSRGLPVGVVAQTRCLAVVTRTGLRSLAALRLYAPDVTSAVAAESGCAAGLIVIGAGAPYGATEVARHFGWPVWGEVPWQPADASVLSDGAPPRPRYANRPLPRAYTTAADQLRSIADRWDAQVGRTVDPPALDALGDPAFRGPAYGRMTGEVSRMTGEVSRMTGEVGRMTGFTEAIHG